MTEAKRGIKLTGRRPSDPQVGLADQVLALLPTPTTWEQGNDSRWEQRRAELVARKINGNGAGVPLDLAVTRLLPSPTTGGGGGDGFDGKWAERDGAGGPRLATAVGGLVRSGPTTPAPSPDGSSCSDQPLTLWTLPDE